MTRVAALLSCGFLLLGLPGVGQVAAQQGAVALVQKLGDSSFAVRQQAARQLVELGSAAEPALRQGLQDADEEVRRRCQELLPLALRRDVDRKIEAFLKDAEDRQPPLAGWPRFRKMTGAARNGRELYAAMYRAAPALLELTERDPKAAGSQIAARARTLEEAFLELDQDNPTLAEVIVVLFLATDSRIPLDGSTFRAVCTALNGLSYRPNLNAELQKSVSGRALLLAFLQRSDDPTARAALDLARNLAMKESVAGAVEAALEKKLPANTRASALLLLGKLGGRDLIPRLEPLLDEATPLGTVQLRRIMLTTQLSDVALAALVQLSGQQMSAYGFSYLEIVPGLKAFPSPDRLGFATPAARQAAIQKWKSWSAAHPIGR
jgi:hypothetical protein